MTLCCPEFLALDLRRTSVGFRYLPSDVSGWAVTVHDVESAGTTRSSCYRCGDHRVEAELTEAVRSARQAHRSWSEIGTMLGVSKQAAQRKYGSKLTA